MKFMHQIGIVLACSALHVGAVAQSVETKMSASNGVVISRISDDFAELHEYTAPTIETKTSKGASVVALPAKVRKGATLSEFHVVGFVMYTGEWRYYDAAVFRGGEAVDFTRTSGKVGSCRYGCSLTENFTIHLTPAQIAKYTEAGNVVIQIRSRSLDTAQLSIPVSSIDAVNEVAK